MSLFVFFPLIRWIDTPKNLGQILLFLISHYESKRVPKHALPCYDLNMSASWTLTTGSVRLMPTTNRSCTARMENIRLVCIPIRFELMFLRQQNAMKATNKHAKEIARATIVTICREMASLKRYWKHKQKSQTRFVDIFFSFFFTCKYKIKI